MCRTHEIWKGRRQSNKELPIQKIETLKRTQNEMKMGLKNQTTQQEKSKEISSQAE